MLVATACQGAAARLPADVRAALDARQGAALVVALPEKSVIAEYGSPSALRESHPTGSAIKPLTALIALSSGTLQPGTEVLCRREVRSGDKRLRCAHPTVLVPLGLREALSLSCNYFFAQIGRRAGAQALEGGFRKAGFQADIADPALGAAGAEGVRATPAQLLDFFISLAQQTAPFAARHVALVRGGLEAAARDGTASAAALAGIAVAGKTGTAAWPGVRFRNSGWFAGWAPAGQPRLALVVWLRRGEGRDAAALAGRILRQEFAESRVAAPGGPLRVELFTSVPLTRLTVQRPGGERPLLIEARSNTRWPVRIDCGQQGCGLNTDARQTGSRRVQGMVQVLQHSGRLRVIHVTGWNEYVAGVLAGEAGEMRHEESLKAMAVAVRTFALSNRGRHAASRFDFCSLTHCQVYTSQAPEARFRRAAQATAAEVLDYSGRPAHAYYTGSCGGRTQSAANVWPEEAAPYLPVRSDRFCANSSNHSWSTRLPAARLESALRGDRAADPGGPLRELRVAARDDSGRVQQLRLTGAHARPVNGNYFRFLVNRRLGWDKLKSTAFDVRREGGDFVFEGRGFGHGVGLCQAGAARMAEAGHDYRRILAEYYPGTRLVKSSAVAASRSGPRMRGPRSQGISSANFDISYPQGTRTDAESVLQSLEAARARFAARGIPLPARRASVVLHGSTASFIAATGKAGWVAAAVDGSRLHLQPPALLGARGTLESTMAHEYLHLALWDATDARLPLWFREGIVLYFSGEQPYANAARLQPPATLEQALGQPRSREELRAAYARALEETRRLAAEVGERGLLRLLRSPSDAELAGLLAVARSPL